MSVDRIFALLSNALEGDPNLAMAAAVGWGVISIALSPCHLTSVPLAIGYVGSRAGPARSPWLLSAAFAATTLAALAALGWLTLAADRVAGDLWGVGPWLAAAALIVSGLMMLDAIALPSTSLLRPDRVPGGLRGAALLGALVGVSLGPCTVAFVAPVAAVALRLSPPANLAVLLGFALGHTLATLLVGGLGIGVARWLQRGARLSRMAKGALGVGLIALGVSQIAVIP